MADAVPGYELEERLAAAGDVSIHRARELASGRPCVLTVLRADEPPTAEQEERQLRFLEEGRQLLAFEHPNVVRVYDVGSSRGCVWLAHERIEGPSLREALEVAGGTIDPGAALAVGIQLARALAAMDRVQLVHRDVSPVNVRIDRRGRACLTGFGANFESGYDRLSMGRAPLKGVDSLSPEQVEGDLPVDSRTDVYGLGTTLYRCLAGRVPHSGASLLTRLRAIAHDTPPDLRELAPGVPDPLAELIARFMEWDPDDRPLPADVAPLLEDVAARVGLASEGWEVRTLSALAAEATGLGPTAEAPLGVRLRGTDRTVEHALALGEGFEVGRAHDADLSLRHGWISRRHARIERRGEGLVLVDLGSANGSTVNGVRVEDSQVLAEGDLIAFGKSRFEVSILSGEAAAAPTMHCQLCGQELTGQDFEEGDTGAVCVRCQAGAEAHQEAADHRVRLALEEAKFEVQERLSDLGILRRYRVRRRTRPFLASAIELGPRTARLFADGSRRAMEVKHPALLPALDLEARSGVLIVVCEDRPGLLLEDHVIERGPLSAAQIAALGRDLCEASAYALSEGLEPLLLRPDLVLLDPAGRALLLDVGLAPGLLEAARRGGGPGPLACYEAPEAALAQRTSPQAAVYAVGATLSFALTGSPVAEIRGGERYDHLPLTMISNVPRALADVLARATAPDPLERHADPLALRDDLLARSPEPPRPTSRGREDLLDDDEITRPVDLTDLGDLYDGRA